MSPKSDSPISTQKFNNQDIKRPLKINHSDLSFKGLSFDLYKPLKKTYSKKEVYKFLDKYVDNGVDFFKDVTEKHKSRTSKLISVNGDKITINKKTIPLLVWDNAIYIFKILPADILEGMIEGLSKVPGLKKWAGNILEKPFFKNIRQRSKIDSKVNSLTGLITFRDVKIKSAKEAFAKREGKKVSELTKSEISKITKDVDKNLSSGVFQAELKQFDPKSGNYDTKHERSLNRLVSGLPPAVFLANDAYNLSRMMDDDPKAAEKERKIRFKQEVTRILTSGYITLITMGAFQKFINKSKGGIVLTTGLTVLVTEMFSRLSNGKHITRLTPEEARAENEKMHAPEAKIKPIEQKKQVSSTGLQENVKPKEQQKPLLSFDTVMKASAAVLGTGYAIKGFKNLPAVQKAALKYFEKMKIANLEKFNKLKVDETFEKLADDLRNMDPKKYENMSAEDLNIKNAVNVFKDKVVYKPFKDLYEKLTSEPFIVERAKFDKVVKVLRENGFEKMADRYEDVGKAAEKTVDGKLVVDLGKKDREVKPFKNFIDVPIKVKPFVNFIIAPFKFMWNTVTLPYWMIDEKLMNVFRKAKPKSASKDITAVANSFDRIYRQAVKSNFNAKEFEDFIQINRMKGFNVDSLSSISNAELSNLAKTAASIATIWFLMTDNYNMVMLKSNGNDKEGANTKFKERFVQEGSRLFYQTLLIDLFNSTFRNSYNSSLLGMSWVTLVDTTLGEMLTRSSVGTPLKAHTRDELIDIETKQNNSTGFKKKYYNFMQRLTGKRSIKSYEVTPKNNTQTSGQTSIPSVMPDKNVIFKQNNSVLEQMIKNG